MTTISNIIQELETFAPIQYQEEYDNSGLIVGAKNTEVNKILLALDCTEEVIQEAIEKGCEIVVAHHPIVFRGLKKLNGGNYIERSVIKAIKNDIAIYAIHTNLDNAIGGVNFKIAEKIGLGHVKILAPKDNTLLKLEVFVPEANTKELLEALYQAGAGHIGNYQNCSYTSNGIGSFMPKEDANPYLGKNNEQAYVNEQKIEVLVPVHLKNKILNVLFKTHPYEEVAYFLHSLINKNQEIGSGVIGRLKEPINTKEFLLDLKTKFKLSVLKHTDIHKDTIQTIALCGGSGSFLTQTAIAQNADIFISADFKYHEYFDADGKIIIADIGHYESEICTKELLYDNLCKKFPNIAVVLSETVTNPISYL